jgi:AAA domain
MDLRPVAFTVDELLPASGVVWWGGPPKRFKSLLCLYACLAISSGRDAVAGHFQIRSRPRILYVAREDGGSRLQGRRDDILAAWSTGPAAGAIRFLIRPRFDLLNPAHVAWLRDVCVKDGISLLVLDTWTALSPGADPMAAVDQAALAAVVVELAEAIGGAVVVVDHSRKNRGEDQPLSSADIFGPMQKWAAAEHIVMMDLTTDRRRLELFIEGKDGETRRCFLSVTPRGESGEKFTYSGTVEEIADAQRDKGHQNRDAVHHALCAAAVAQGPAEVQHGLRARGVSLALDTVSNHLRALTKAGRASVIGKGSATKYLGIPEAPSSVIERPRSELFDEARS